MSRIKRINNTIENITKYKDLDNIDIYKKIPLKELIRIKNKYKKHLQILENEINSLTNELTKTKQDYNLIENEYYVILKKIEIQSEIEFMKLNK